MLLHEKKTPHKTQRPSPANFPSPQQISPSSNLHNYPFPSFKQSPTMKQLSKNILKEKTPRTRPAPTAHTPIRHVQVTIETKKSERKNIKETCATFYPLAKTAQTQLPLHTTPPPTAAPKIATITIIPEDIAIAGVLTQNHTLGERTRYGRVRAEELPEGRRQALGGAGPLLSGERGRSRRGRAGALPEGATAGVRGCAGHSFRGSGGVTKGGARTGHWRSRTQA